VADRVEVLIAGDSSGLVRATDQASSAMQDFGRTTSGLSRVADAFRSDFARLIAAFGAAQLGVSAVVGAFESAGRAVQAMNAEVIDAERVASKLIAVFDGAEGAAARLTAQAEALAGSTVFFDDDAIKAAAAALRAFDLAEQEIGKLLPAAVNLATVFGTDLETAANKLALGLNGSTRGLREFGIVVKEGADRGEIMAQILERGEKAAKGAADAQGGLRGATEGLKKAQAEFNQALGNLLSGPQSAFLQFLTDATNGATNLANRMTGAAESLIKTAKVIDPLTGKIVEATGIGGRDLFGPGSLTAKYMKGEAPARAAVAPKPEAPVARARGRGTDETKPAAAATAQGIGPGLELGPSVNVFKALNAAQLAADYKATLQNEEYKTQEGKKRNDDMLKATEAAALILEQGSRNTADGIVAAGRIFVDLLQGNASLGGIIRSLSGVATSLGAGLGGPVGAALASVGVEVAAAVADQLKPTQTAGEKLYEAGVLLVQAGKITTEKEREAKIQELTNLARAQGLRESDIARASAMARGERTTQTAGARRTQGIELVPGSLVYMGGKRIDKISAEGLGSRAGQYGVIGAEMDGGLRPELGNFKPEPLPSFVSTPGAGLFTQLPEAAPANLPTPPKVESDAFNQLVKLLEELYAIQLDESGKGMTERQPLFVFDVSAGKDEFTRAPRGLFFRPVGSGRGVDAGQAVSGVSANTSNRAAIGRTNQNVRMA